MEPYRVLLCDDEEQIRVGISRKIDWASLGFSLIGEAENGTEALELAEQLQPDVVLTDIKMPFMDGLELCQHLKQSLPAAKLVVFSGFDDFEYARKAIGMNVSEYILKPITAPELEAVLTKLRKQLEQQRLEKQNLEALRQRYEESLPILRELFFTHLLDGKIEPDQIQVRGKQYDLELSDGTYAVALLHVDTAGSELARDELLLSLRAFLGAQFHLPDCPFRAVLYNDMIALLAHLPSEAQIYPFLKELERLILLARSYVDAKIVAGVGLPCNGTQELHRAVEEAREALDYRALLDGNVIYIDDLEPDRSAHLSFEESDQRALAAAVKLGSRDSVAQIVHQLLERVRVNRLPLAQCHLYILEIVTCLIKLARSGNLEVEDIFGPSFTGVVSVTDFSSHEELGRWLTDCALKLHDLLGRQRSDSAWHTIETAKDFIAQNYQNPELSVEMLCAQLHLSPTYFSTLFKRETEKSFTAYVTEIRMEHAAQLLRDTDEKTYLIAERTGYLDPNYFSYVFKRSFGLSPSKYRAGNRS